MEHINDFPVEIELSFHKIIEKLESRMHDSQSSISKDYMQ